MKPSLLAVLLLIGCVQVWAQTTPGLERAGHVVGSSARTSSLDSNTSSILDKEDSNPFPPQCRKPNDEEALDVLHEPPLPDESPCLSSVTDLAKQIHVPASCCPDPTWTCLGSGGNCWTSWLVENNIVDCDVVTNDRCENYPHCQCCVDCGSNVCSPCNRDRFTSCRANCTATQFAVNKPCHSHHCQCCKECQVETECSDVGGHCVGDPSYCTDDGFFASTSGCKGDGCHCCRPAGPCMPLPECESGRCSTDPCEEDEIRIDTGCLGPNCHCCFFRVVFEGNQ